ncbi:aminotransferase-like domain-containing protein [Psychroflexus halocasei]|uniref:GntR family transcriptional regulator / MocR family aminotransferase n=1 Tax=Psychroflexus halocasei TaxID=908615 RepID=A0A1H4B2T2_9FLAO|nr:PLP-dependent aminotransferase family protein [Psychroflexus halocasei]SEA42431.1 GntR family transcriptional regulator / MocR family aminotransferase [Psychroflexus halocasei]
MSSPVKISFKSFIKIDRRKKEAIYMQIVYQFINAVKSNLLEQGDQLPGSRKIATELQVHRQTVIAALEELQEQGWVKMQANLGTFVKNPEIYSKQNEVKKTFQQPPKKASYHFRKEFILDSPLDEHQEKFYFTDGTPDARVISTEELGRFYSSVMRRKKNQSTVFNTDKSKLFFKNQLSYYLNLSRGFHLSRDYLLPITSLEQVHSILARLLINSGDMVLVEEYSYFLSNMIFNQAGAQIKTTPIDAEGMDVEYIRKHFKPGEIRFVYLNTRSQYPTTKTLSEQRRKQLLRLAKAYDFIIIENDIDFEFSILNKKESLLSLDGADRVIYIGSFGRFLNPGFQMNFIIAAEDFLEEAAKYLNVYGKPDIMMKKALGELIHQGDIHRYQRKSKKVIAERKEGFAKLLDLYFKNQITFEVPDSGLAFWIQFKKFFSLTELQKKAKEKELFIPRICLYQDKKIRALRLGFAHFNQQEMETAIETLAQAYLEVLDKN